MQIALVALGLTVPAMLHADQQIATKYAMPVKVMGKVTTTGCQNSPGPQIVLEGELLLGGMQVELIFQNNAKGTRLGYNPYESGLLKRKPAAPKRDLRELSKWIEMKKRVDSTGGG